MNTIQISEIFASDQMGFPILSILVWLPVLTLVLLAFIRNDMAARSLALASTAVELALATMVWLKFDGATANMQFVEHAGLYQLGVDGVSVLFLPVTALLMLLTVMYSEPAVKSGSQRHYLMAMLGFEASMMGAFASVDLLMFWIFFAAEIIPSYFLIANFGTGEKRVAAAKTYLSYMVVASVLVLAGLVMLAGAAGGESTYDWIQLMNSTIPPAAQATIFLLLFLGLAIKAPLFPFHTWMPKVLEQGPIVGMSVYIVGVKLGTYAFLRFVIPLLPEASHQWLWLMATLGVIGIVYGSLIALIQTNLRRLLAFACLAHSGVVMLGLFSLNFVGFQGGLLQMINLGLTSAGLFFVAGFLHTRMGQPDTSGMGGVGQFTPLLAFSFLVIGLAGVGMPGTSGFNGEHLVMIGAYKMHWGMALAVGAGTFLAAGYFLWFYQRAFLGNVVNPSVRTMPDLSSTEMLIAGAMMGVIFWVGLATTPFLHTMEGSLRMLDDRMRHVTGIEAAPLKGVNAILLHDVPSAAHPTAPAADHGAPATPAMPAAPTSH